MTARVIPTTYAGTRFRSRLEARWAVFFDLLGIYWEYEPEAYLLADGRGYAPDFLLPRFNGGVVAEVKPEGDAFDKAWALARDGHGIWLCEGPPGFRAYTFAQGDDGEVERWTVLPLYDQALGEDRFFYVQDPSEVHYLSAGADRIVAAALIASRQSFWEPGSPVLVSRHTDLPMEIRTL